MSVAIALTAHSDVAGHFGKAAVFVIVDEQNREVARLENPQGRAMGCRHKKQLQQALLAQGVTTLILGNVGQRSLARLLQAGLTVIRVPARSSLAAVLNGEVPKETLTESSQGRPCKREKGSCGCGCGKPKVAVTAKIGMTGAATMTGLTRLGGVKL